MAPRVRFAPSPTGLLHVGNARTALYNWLFARQHAGTYILRIEDTDLARSERAHETQLLEDLRWLGLDWDFGPGVASAPGASGVSIPGAPESEWRQSDRLPIYHAHAQRLLDEHKAYRCFCTQAELEAERHRAIAEHRPQVYSGKCRTIPPAVSATRAQTEPFAIRLQIPDAPITFHDIVRGTVTFAAHDVSDPVLVRSSETPGQLGVPVYNFVATVDDALMQITHVIRGDDHLSNTPKQVAIYHAFGWNVPEFAHLSTILGEDRQRLSKRHGATSIAAFRDMGYLPEAMVNYLALLGWAPTGGDRELFTPQELVREFSLERVTPSPATFDFAKLAWINRHYLKAAPLSRIAELALPYFVTSGYMNAQLSGEEEQWLHLLLQMLLPSVDHLSQLPERAASIFVYDAKATRIDPANAAILAAPAAHAVIAELTTRIGIESAHTQSRPLTAARFKEIVNEVKAATGVKGKELFMPIRVALTGSEHGPEFDKLVPVIELGSTLALPTPVLSIAARLAAFTNAPSRNYPD